MHQEADRTKLFSRRAMLIGGGQTALFGVLGARLYHLQVNEAENYELLAEDNRISQRLIVPPRGRIFERGGRPLARNIPTYRALIIREQTQDIEQTLHKLAGLIHLDDERIQDILNQARRRRAFVPILVSEELSWNDVGMLSIRAPDLPGVALESGLLRDYPHANEVAHLLGYVGPVNEAEIAEDDDPLLKIPSFRIGKSGIESYFDHQLRGRAGLKRMEVNAIGRQIRQLDFDPGDAGRDLHLTLDLDLQKFAFERLSSELAASAVVLDVETGAVRALASVPSFDPRVFTTGLSQRQWVEWRDNPRTPLVNKSIRGQYPPGSTFKMITALAALEAGVVSPTYESYCPGYMRLGRSRFHCWKEYGHGRMALREALEQSCDVYFYDIAKRVGVDAIAAMGKRFGLGDITGVDLPGELGGLLPTREWKKAKIGESWQKGETLVVGIGQGFVLATPLQLAVMTARLCNGGRGVKPSFVEQSTIDAPPIGVSSQSIAAVLEGMRAVVHGRRGTARKAQLPFDGIEMAGKTGTSQVKRITRAERAAGLHKRKDKPWEHRHHALFTCFAPFDKPRYAVSVIVEHGESGSKAAAPIAKDIMTKAIGLDIERGISLAATW